MLKLVVPGFALARNTNPGRGGLGREKITVLVGVTVTYNSGGSNTATVLVTGPDGNAGTVPKLFVMALSAPTKT